MNINDIKAALAARAQAANVKPATPVIEPPALEALPRQLVVEAARAVSRDLYRYRLSENAAP